MLGYLIVGVVNSDGVVDVTLGLGLGLSGSLGLERGSV